MELQFRLCSSWFHHLSDCPGKALFLNLCVELRVELKLLLLDNLQPRGCQSGANRQRRVTWRGKEGKGNGMGRDATEPGKMTYLDVICEAKLGYCLSIHMIVRSPCYRPRLLSSRRPSEPAGP